MTLKSQKEEQGSWGGLDADSLRMQFNCNSHGADMEMKVYYEKELFKRRLLVDKTKWQLYWMGGLKS